MSRDLKHLGRWFAITAAIGLFCAVETPAAKPAKPPADGPAYTIVDLPGPYHAVDGWSRTYAERISDLGAEGVVYVVGSDDDGWSLRPCLWTIDERGVNAEDLTGMIDDVADVNSAGIVAGDKDGLPMLLLANNEPVYLESTGYAEIRAISNPDSDGTFHIVGVAVLPGEVLRMRWDVSTDGSVLSRTALSDLDGHLFFPTDVADSGAMAGRLKIDSEYVPALAMFVEQGLQTWPRPNPNPQEIDGFDDVHLDVDGNMLGDGYKRGSSGGSFYPRAVIWPAAGGAIDLTAEYNRTTTGRGIAVVNGVMQVVGRAENKAGSLAYLYMNGRFTNLEVVSKGDQPWAFDRAEGLNRTGMICGVGNVGSPNSRQTHGFVLIPNEP